MPKGYPIDEDTVLRKLRQIRHVMKNEYLNATQALRQAGLSQTTYNRWLRALGPPVGLPAGGGLSHHLTHPESESPGPDRAAGRARRAGAA